MTSNAFDGSSIYTLRSMLHMLMHCVITIRIILIDARNIMHDVSLSSTNIICPPYIQKHHEIRGIDDALKATNYARRHIIYHTRYTVIDHI